MSLVALLVFIILVVPISLGVLAGIIALLINPRTRVATGIVLVVAPLILLVGAALFWSATRVKHQMAAAEAQQRAVKQQMEMRRSIERSSTPPSGHIPVEQGYYQEGTAIQPADGSRYYQEGADIQRAPSTFPTKGSSSMSWSFALPAFMLVALVSLGVLAGIIALLINPRTRVAAGIVLVVAVPVILLVAAGLYWGHSSHLISEGLSLLVFLVFLGVLAGIIALLINPRTRVATGIVLVVAPVILLVVAALQFSVRKVAYNESNSIEYSPNTGINTYPPIAPPEAAEKPAVKPPPPSLAAGGTAARPAWVDAPPQLVDDVYQMAITVGPYTTRQECDAKLPEAIQEAVDQYVEVCLGPEEIDAVCLPAEYLRQQLVKDQWEEVRQHSIGPMTQLHVLLQFDRGVKDRVLEEHRQAVVAHRLWLTGAGLTAALGLLAAAFGYLKLTGFRVQGSEVRDKAVSSQ